MDYIIGIAFLVIMYWLIRFAWGKNQDELKRASLLTWEEIQNKKKVYEEEERNNKRRQKQIWTAFVIVFSVGFLLRELEVISEKIYFFVFAPVLLILCIIGIRYSNGREGFY